MYIIVMLRNLGGHSGSLTEDICSLSGTLLRDFNVDSNTVEPH